MKSAANQTGAKPAQQRIFNQPRHHIGRHFTAHNVHRCRAHKASGQNQRVGTFTFQKLGDFDGIFKVLSAMYAIAQVHFAKHCEITFGRVTDFRNHLLQKRIRLRRAAAILIAASVCERRQKLANQIAVSGVDFDRIKALRARFLRLDQSCGLLLRCRFCPSHAASSDHTD